MKIFWSILIGIIIIISVLVFFSWKYLPSWISDDLSQKAKVPVSITRLTLTPNNIGVYGLKVKNPKEFRLAYALKVKKIQSKAPLRSYFHDNVIIDQLDLNTVYLGLEFESPVNSKGNWTAIMNNLRGSLREDSSKEEKSSQKKVLIKKLIIRNLDIDLLFKTGKKDIKRLKPIPYMEFKNVSSEGGMPTSQIMNLIMSEVLKEVFSKENLMNMLKGTLDSPGRGGAEVFNSLKSLFSQLEETKLEKIQ
jgi:hypothetical protein